MDAKWVGSDRRTWRVEMLKIVSISVLFWGVRCSIVGWN
jgi:hypothetical protein